MGRRRAEAELRRDAEFAAFTAGAGGRLLHAATLLTGDPQAAEDLLTTVLARVYADWFRMRAEDPYEQARSEMVRRFSYRPWWRRPHGGQLDRLSAQERLIVTMRFFEGIAEEQTAAQLGLPTERVNAISARAAATLRSRPQPAPAASRRAIREDRDGRGKPEGAGTTRTGEDGPEDRGAARTGGEPRTGAHRAGAAR